MLNAYPNTSDGNFDMCAQKLNVLASPAFVVWKGNVSILATGQAFNGVEWAGMTGTNHSRLQTVAQYLAAGYNAALGDIRGMFADIWSGAGGAIYTGQSRCLVEALGAAGRKDTGDGHGIDGIAGNDGL